jgi:hypothetical protein
VQVERALQVVLVHAATGEVGEVVEPTTVVVTAMVPYVDPNEVKTVEGEEKRRAEKVEARVELEPKSTSESTVTLPAAMDTMVTAEVDTPAETAISDLKLAVKSEVNVASVKLDISRVEKETVAETLTEEAVGLAVGELVGEAVGKVEATAGEPVGVMVGE